jgi:hypothetical protein
MVTAIVLLDTERDKVNDVANALTALEKMFSIGMD